MITGMDTPMFTCVQTPFTNAYPILQTHSLPLKNAFVGHVVALGVTVTGVVVGAVITGAVTGVVGVLVVVIVESGGDAVVPVAVGGIVAVATVVVETVVVVVTVVPATHFPAVRICPNLLEQVLQATPPSL